MTGTEQGGRRRAWADGFTMIELLVVVSLVVILASIGMAQYRNAVTRAQEAVLKEDLYRMRDVIDQYYADKQEYPQALEDLVTSGYLRAVPKDPFTGSAETWQLIEAEPDPAQPTAQIGIYNVKSGSEKTALDGSKYSDW
ncbi:MAG: type IV pilin protein [Rhodospirillaceae bacterium]